MYTIINNIVSSKFIIPLFIKILSTLLISALPVGFVMLDKYMNNSLHDYYCFDTKLISPPTHEI